MLKRRRRRQRKGKEMATWHSRVGSPAFTATNTLAGSPMSVSLPGLEAEVIEQPTADELRRIEAGLQAQLARLQLPTGTCFSRRDANIE